jgi:hypothetical protein
MKTMFPMKISCYGRNYEVRDQGEFDDLIWLLTDRQLRRANQYRVGASWPRGRRAKESRDWSLWYCGDCDRHHRMYTDRCPVSERERTVIQRSESAPSVVAVDPSVPPSGKLTTRAS